MKRFSDEENQKVVQRLCDEMKSLNPVQVSATKFRYIDDLLTPTFEKEIKNI